MMTEEHHVIIGNGPAANQAAETLRNRAPDVRITMIGREQVRYYQPHLLPDYVAGRLTEEDLFVNPLDFYKKHGIKLRLGQEVVDVDFRKREIILGHKEIIRYSGLIIAVGGKPGIPEPLSVFSDLVLTLKTLADANSWIEALAKTDSVLVIGGDLTSLAITRALLEMNKKVSFVLEGNCFWPLHLREEICAEARGRLEAKGVEVLTGRRLKRITRLTDDTLEVETDEERMETGLVGAFFGLRPDVAFLARTGLHIERGVLVDEHLRTRFPGVYAAGDCAQVYHPGIRDYWVSIGFDNAVNLGRIAAENLLGGTTEPEADFACIFDVDGVKVNTSWWLEF
jgi:3-phenylpropionate/trans-cinnamate dioxygenase ferredoxin reductase component